MAKPGRPLAVINWEEAEKLCSYHCTQKELCDFFGVDLNTLQAACKRDLGLNFSDFFAQKKGAGRGRLRKIQWSLAEQGSTPMAIYLGKVVLGQTDSPLDQDILDAAASAGMGRDEVLELIQGASIAARAKGLRSYEEFCAIAGYPRPFAKQVEMKDFGMGETGPRLLLGARGYGKTDYVVILGIAYDLYVDPLGSTNLIITKSKERNAAMLQEISAAAVANGVEFSHISVTRLRVKGLRGKDHSVSAVTINTVTLRGRHPKRVIMDDPVTEDDTSEVTRLKVKKKYFEITKLCSNILIIGQPAHKYDLYAELRPLLKKLEVPHGTIKELDHDLEAQRLAGVDDASISASYHLKILDEGTMPFDGIQYVDTFGNSEPAIAFIDPANEGEDSTAMSIIKGYMGGVKVVGFMWRKSWHHCLSEIATELRRFNVQKLAFETNALGEQPIDVLRQNFGSTGVVGRKSVLNKHAKIMSVGPYAKHVHLSKESHPKFITQVVQYEYGVKHDDAPDSLASGLEWVGLIRGK